MEKNWVKKSLVFGIIGLFIGISIMPIISANIPPPQTISPGTVSPTNSPGMRINSLTPKFIWNEVADADFYGLYIRELESNEIVFNSIDLGLQITGTVENGNLYYEIPSGIVEDGKRYVWNMNSHSNIDGWGTSYSDKKYFHTNSLGIDVSHWQGKIDWEKVKDSEYSFAFVKASEGKSDNDILILFKDEEGIVQDDPDNGKLFDGYPWWYVQFDLIYGTYTGWCAGKDKVGNPLLLKKDTGSSDFGVGDRVKVNLDGLRLRSTHYVIVHSDGLNDEYFLRNMEMASNQFPKKIWSGAYHFAWPNLLLTGDSLKDDAKVEANHFYDVAKKYLKVGYLRPALDLEYDGLAFGIGKELSDTYKPVNLVNDLGGGNLIKEKLSIWIDTWMTQIRSLTKENGLEIKPIIYTGLDFTNNYILKDLADKYELWIAWYDAVSPFDDPYAGVWSSWSFWQYTDQGIIPGITGNVDLDIFNGISTKLIKNFVIQRGLDCIFCIDTTGSMWDDISAVKSSASNIINQIVTDIPNSRIAIVDYKDYPSYPYGNPSDYLYHDTIPFTSDVNNIITALQGLSASGGADERESIFSALMHTVDAISLGGWRSGEIVAKIIIQMGDAPPHNPEPFPPYFTFDFVKTTFLNTDPVQLYTIQIGSPIQEMEDLADQTGGKVFLVSDSTEVVGTILEIIEEIKSNPFAEANGPYESYINQPITLDGTGSYDPDGTIVNYEWDLDNDGQFDDAFGVTPTITWTTIYSGDIGLRVTDSDGNTDIDTTTIVITMSNDNTPPTTTKTICVPKYGTNDEWVTSNTKFNLTSIDDFSDVQVIYYRIWYNGVWTSLIEYTENFTLSGEGKHYLEYYSEDNAWNIEETHNQTHYVDDTAPSITVEIPSFWEALQDGITFRSLVTDACGVDWVKYAIRNPGGAQGTIINPMYESLIATSIGDDKWQLLFDTILLPDGHYVLHVNASDMLGNERNTIVNFSIRNWAVLEMLPNTANSKAGRTMPIKFSLRVALVVDPTQPFVRNEELIIKIYVKGIPGTILQTSVYGINSKDYRIDPISEKYITNFKTLSTPKTYVVDIWRDTLRIGSFEFKTTK